MGHVILQLGRRSPGEFAVVGDVLSDRVEGLHVGAGTTQQHQGDGSRSGRLPGDFKGAAHGDLLVKARRVDRVARRRLRVVGLRVGGGKRRQGSEERRSSEETHLQICVVINSKTKSNGNEWIGSRSDTSQSLTQIKKRVTAVGSLPLQRDVLTRV